MIGFCPVEASGDCFIPTSSSSGRPRWSTYRTTGRRDEVEPEGTSPTDYFGRFAVRLCRPKRDCRPLGGQFAGAAGDSAGAES